MRLLADENFPRKAVSQLREMGHDTVWVHEDRPGIGDKEVLSWARRETRILLTFDKDFGELAFRSMLPAECGIVLFRIPPIPARIAEAVERLFYPGTDFKSLFVVVEPWRVRERSLLE